MPHPTSTPGITARIAELAARSTGVASNDPGLSLWDVTVICNVANKMVKRRQLFKVKYSHRSVRYFGNERDAAAAAPGPTRGLVAHLITPKSTRQMPSATWAAAEPVITSKTKFTIGPSHPPRFREVVLPFVHGGNQRGRV